MKNDNVTNTEKEGHANRESRKDILESIKTPLIFYALALLIIESVLATSLYSGKLQGNQNLWLVCIMSGLFFFVVIIVTVLTYYVPSNLMNNLKNAIMNDVKPDIVNAATRTATEIGERTSAALVRSQIAQGLKNIKYELSSFSNRKNPICLSQKVSEQSVEQKNPYLTYLKPGIERFLEDPELKTRLGDEFSKNLNKWLSDTKKSTIAETIAGIDGILGDIHSA